MSTPGPVVKGILRMAGTAMNDFLPKLLNVGGKVGQKAATGALDAGKRTFAPGLVGKAAAETPELLRSGSRSTIPVAGKLLGQAGALGGAVLLGSMLDQQTENTQSSQGGMDDFLQSQEFVNNVSKIAEEEGHHPDLWFGWGYARIKIFTHAIKGLAESDFILAAKIDKIS